MHAKYQRPQMYTVKDIGKPCAGKPHARFDEGGLETSNRYSSK